MRSPHAFLKTPEVEIISFMNVASNAVQASSTFFEPLKNMIKNAGPKAFEVFGFDKDRDMLDREINFPKNIQLVSGHSQADGLEGKNLLVAVADEIDADTFSKPGKMWTMLQSSSKTRFAEFRKIIAISYVRYEGSNGMIMKLHDEFIKDPNAHVARYPTWIFNPRKDLTREVFDEEFRKNPEQAACIYACEPPVASIDAWIKDHERILKSMEKTGKDRWPLTFPLPNENWKNIPTIEAFRFNEEKGYQETLNPFDLPFKTTFRGKPGVKYVFVGDPGLGTVQTGGDAYGITLAHRDIIYSPEGKKLVRPIIDFTFRFTGYMFKEREIQFSAIHELIKKLKEELGFDIRVFSFDEWNSSTTAQFIRQRYGKSVVVNYKKYVDYTQYSQLRQQIFGEEPPSSGNGEKLTNGGIDWFWHPILYDEIINVVEDRTGKTPKVDHKKDSSKDILDSVVSAVYILTKQWPYNSSTEVSAGTLQMELEKAKNNNKTDNKDYSYIIDNLEKMSANAQEEISEISRALSRERMSKT